MRTWCVSLASSKEGRKAHPRAGQKGNRHNPRCPLFKYPMSYVNPITPLGVQSINRHSAVIFMRLFLQYSVFRICFGLSTCDILWCCPVVCISPFYSLHLQRRPFGNVPETNSDTRTLAATVADSIIATPYMARPLYSDVFTAVNPCFT